VYETGARLTVELQHETTYVYDASTRIVERPAKGAASEPVPEVAGPAGLAEQIPPEYVVRVTDRRGRWFTRVLEARRDQSNSAGTGGHFHIGE
jgi:hypothetical protein